jgi:integrase
MTFRPTDKPKVITSAKAIEYLTEPGRYRDPQTPGLYLQVVNRNARSWVLRYQFRGRPRNMGLGPFPLVTLSKARQLAREARIELKTARVDPLEAREQEKAEYAKKAKVVSFRQAAEGFYAKASLEWKKDSQRRDFRSAMERYVYPFIGKKPVASIDVDDVLKVLQHENLWLAKPTAAQILRMRLDQILTWATAARLRTDDNPASLKGPLSLLLPDQKHKTKHHESMPYRNLPRFMGQLRAADSVASKALELLILTATRLEETLQARWEEIDFTERTWRIPAQRMKPGEDHIVPLSDAAISILKSIPREDDSPFVFVGRKRGGHISENPLRTLIKKYSHIHVTNHGFRSTFRQWGENETEFSPHILEEVLSHVVTSKVERAYRREKPIAKHRKVIEAWARFCAGERDTDNVIELRGRAK